VVKHTATEIQTEKGQETGMIVKHFTRILYVCGALTMLPIVMFFVPWAMFSLTGISVGNGIGVAFVKHWGLMAFCFGALLIYSAHAVEMRRPILIAAGIEKMGLCVIVLAGWDDSFMTALRPIALIDGCMVLLFGLYLLSGAASPPDPARTRF
jgi:hypothetical protein